VESLALGELGGGGLLFFQCGDMSTTVYTQSKSMFARLQRDGAEQSYSLDRVVIMLTSPYNEHVTACNMNQHLALPDDAGFRSA